MSRFQRIVRLESTGSTNVDVARILGEEQARGLVLVAAHQTDGSGRRGRAWVAAPGSALLCTLALPDAVRSSDLWAVPFWAALVTRAALTSIGVQSALQWPNDVLAQNGRKIAGVLCISRVVGEFAWAGCGIGINIVRPADEQAFAGLETPPAFASDFQPRAVVEDALAALVEAADAEYDLLAQPQSIIARWEAAARVPGTRYRILMDGEEQPFDATALRLSQDGSLLVDRGGNHVSIALADARVLR